VAVALAHKHALLPYTEQNKQGIISIVEKKPDSIPVTVAKNHVLNNEQNT
jgi:hypothetical protein